MSGPDLPLVFAGIIGFSVAMYVLMDGFDLGVGILFPLAKSEDERDVVMNTVAPIWDGNETWLVMGGAALFGAFPLAYSLLLPALYLPVFVMLIALVFRGVAFEFRFKATRERWLWSWAFAGGSIIATFAQGVVLGAFVQGFAVQGRDYAGGGLDWLTPFSLVTGLALIAGYALLGATWLIWRTDGPLQDWARRLARPVLAAVVVAMAVVSLWVPFLDTEIGQRWFAWPNLLYLSPVPLAVAGAALGLWRGLERGAEALPFLLAMALFLLGFAGLVISLFPYIVPPDVSIWQAAAPPESQGFLLVGTVLVIPFVLGYTAWAYWVFRGKVTAETGYHH